jgi:DNA-binding Lrp family transcriptional regulator
MPYPRLRRAALVAGIILIAMATGPSVVAAVEEPKATEADWKMVDEALGKSGQIQPGGVYRVAMPRTDLKVKVQGVDVKAGFALGSYAAFKKMGKGAMVMGDLVLLDEEVSEVQTRLLQKGLLVTALHNHLNEMTPHVMYMHYSGRGDAKELATALREALSASATPLGQAAAPAAGATASPELDQKQVEAALGRTGRVNNGILQVSVARAEKITENGMELLPAMGVNTALNFQPTGDGKAAITGDFVVIGREVNPVAKALREHGIQVTAVHNHALADNPRLFYMHFWANDDAVKLAKGLKAALDLTNSKKADQASK